MKRDLALAGATALLVAAATVPLSRVFVDGSWRPETLLAMTIALLVVATIRRLGLGAVAATATSLVGLVVFTYVVHLPPGPLVPGTEQLSQAVELVRAGLIEARDTPAPTAPLDGIMILITTGVWFITHVTHELLVRSQRPLLGILPAAVLWTIPLAVPLTLGRTWPNALPFLGAAALVLLIDSDADVAGWVRDVDGPRISAAGLGVGALALVAGIALPAALPGYGQEAWWDVQGSNDPRGYQPIVDVGDRLKLPAERDVLEVQSDRRLYLRIAALETFDRNTWRLGPPGAETYSPDSGKLYRTVDPLPPEVPIRESTEVMANVRVLDLENIYVPVPYQPVEILGPERDQMVYSTVGGFVATGQTADNEIGGELRTGVTQGFEYRVRAALPTPSVEQLRGASFDSPDLTPYLQLPRPYESLAEEARRVYEAAGAETALDRAFALQQYFIGDGSEFRYSTQVDRLVGDGALEDFVLDSKTGYCEYYASGMAVMLRATGIPARVSVGFLSGRLTRAADPAAGRELETYTVSTSDAHAWVEVLFPGYGWIRFDPTPRSDGSTLAPTRDDLDPLLTLEEREAGIQDPIEQPSADASSSPAPTDPTDVPRGVGGAQEDPGTADAADGGIPWPLWLGGIVALLAAGAVLAGRRRDAHETDLPAQQQVLAAQRRVHTAARRYGVGRRPFETAEELARRWVHEGRVEPAVAHRFTALSQAAAFGGVLDAGAADEARELAPRLESSLRASVPRRARLVAPVRVPAQAATSAAQQAAGRLRTLVLEDED